MILPGFTVSYSHYPNIINTLESEAAGRGNTEAGLAVEAYCFLALFEGE